MDSETLENFDEKHKVINKDEVIIALYEAAKAIETWADNTPGPDKNKLVLAMSLAEKAVEQADLISLDNLLSGDSEWISVKDGLPKIKSYGDSERVIVSVHDMDIPDDDSSEIEHELYEPFFTAVGYITKTSTGCWVWRTCDDGLMEEFECVVTHWMPMPAPQMILD